MAKAIKVPALRVHQKRTGEGGDIYATKLKVGDLIERSQFVVDLWDPEKRGADDQGYQREINDRRATSIASFIETNDRAIFPTSILLSCRKKLKFDTSDESIGELTIGGSANEYPLYIIDGQHRVGGLRHAITKDGHKELADIELPVIILSNFDKLEEIRQFYILNTYQKKVNTSLAQRLIADLAGGDEKELLRVKEGGKLWEIASLRLIDLLNESPKSPWKGKIKIPRADKKQKYIVNQTSFLTSLKPLFGAGAVFSIVRDLDDRYRIVEDYWNAIADVFPDAFLHPEQYVIQKTPGVFSLHGLAPHLFARLGLDRVSCETFRRALKKMFDGSDVTSDWWRGDAKAGEEGAAQYGSMKGFKIMTDLFVEHLDEAEL